MAEALPEVPSNDPTQFCRLCFSLENMHWVIRTNGTEVDRPFIDTIVSCLGVWLKLDEDFPCAVCRRCTAEMERILDFREQCRLCDEALKQKRQEDPTALVLFYDYPKDRVFMDVPPKMEFVVDDTNVENEPFQLEVMTDEDNKEQIVKLEEDISVNQSEKELALKSYFESYARWSQRTLTAKDDDEMTVVAPETLEQERLAEIHPELFPDKDDSVNPRSIGWCCLCRRNFCTATNLKSHLAQMHYENGGFNCTVCCKKFPTYLQLREHALRHETQLMISCDKCGIQFRRSHELEAHRKTDGCRVRTSMFGKCRYCDRMFSNKGRYIFHLKALHPDKPIPNLPGIRPSHHSQQSTSRADAPQDKLIHNSTGGVRRIDNNGQFVVLFRKILPKPEPSSDRIIQTNESTSSRTVQNGRFMASLEKLNTNQQDKRLQPVPQAQVDPAEIICTGCFAQFDDLPDFTTHLQQCCATADNPVASAPKPFLLCRCDVCSDIFDQIDQFLEHLQQHDRPFDVKPHDCSLCIEWRLRSTQDPRPCTPPSILGE
ncbi:zinc finger protein 354A-like isoform X2 [Topomyia yanbarensis]|uniref:zinc finger protein 354A-like isoform X2 n=1 Tax=Topomyia yanbarensis TaxID=2498891 RepID=UPI00273B689D|nr:zinc finger protein 354A-like isoform X2 [Topomyia yanbarensis]